MTRELIDMSFGQDGPKSARVWLHDFLKPVPDLEVVFPDSVQLARVIRLCMLGKCRYRSSGRFGEVWDMTPEQGEAAIAVLHVLRSREKVVTALFFPLLGLLKMGEEGRVGYYSAHEEELKDVKRKSRGRA